jgi:predicted transcriptional regulator
MSISKKTPEIYEQIPEKRTPQHRGKNTLINSLKIIRKQVEEYEEQVKEQAKRLQKDKMKL